MESRMSIHQDGQNDVIHLRAGFAKRKSSEKATHLAIHADITIPAFMSNELAKPKLKHIIFVLDKSGSMGPDEGEPIESSNLFLVKAAVSQLIQSDSLENNDLVSVIFFDTVGSLAVDRCTVAEFKNTNNTQRKKFDNVSTNGGCTLIGSGFSAIPMREQNQNYENLIVLLTDGKDYQGKKKHEAGKTEFTNADEVMMDVNEKFGKSLHSIIPILFGKEPSFVLAQQLSIKSKGNLMLPIESSNDINPKMASLTEIIKQIKQGQFELKIKIGNFETTIQDFGNALTGYQYQRSLTIPLEAIGEIEPAVITYVHNGFATTYTTELDITPIPDTPGFKFYDDLEMRALSYCDEFQASLLYRERCLEKDGKLKVFDNTQEPLKQEEVKEISKVFLSLLDYHDQLAEQNEIDCVQTLNHLHGLINELAYICQSHAKHQKKPQSQSNLRIKSGNNASSTHTNNAVKLPKQLLAIVQAPTGAGARTCSNYKSLQKVVSNMVGVHEGRAFIRFSEEEEINNSAIDIPFNSSKGRFTDCLLLDGTFDFTQFPMTHYFDAIISLDGGLTNREGIIISNNRLNAYWDMLTLVYKNLDKTIKDAPLIKRLEANINLLKLLMTNPREEDELSLKIASFHDQKTLKLNNGKEIPCVELANFIEEGKGYCRHQALANALILGWQVARKDLSEGKVTVYRSTAYNQNAHAVTLYETTDENKKTVLYLIDTTLDKTVFFDLLNPKELTEILKIYNDKDLAGFLNHLIEKKNLLVEDPNLLKIDVLNRGMLEEFDEDEDFAPFRCPIELVTPSDPVHLVYKDEKGEEYLSKEVYERSAIEMWMFEQGRELSPVTNQKIYGIVEANDVKKTILQLVEKKREAFSKPEETATTGVILQRESERRLLKRTANRNAQFEKWTLAYENSNAIKNESNSAPSSAVKKETSWSADNFPTIEKQGLFSSNKVGEKIDRPSKKNTEEQTKQTSLSHSPTLYSPKTPRLKPVEEENKATFSRQL